MAVEAFRRQRREQRQLLIDRARQFLLGLPESLDIGAAVIIGSVARGDFNVWSDIDVLVIADDLPRGYLQRMDALGPRPAGVQPILWTLAEYQRELARGNPMAKEAITHGVWLAGSAAVTGRG